LLLGADEFSPGTGKTDAILLAFVDPANGSAALVALPRDLYVYLPAHGMGRINSAVQLGGVDLLAQTFDYNLGLRPDRWALAHMDDFIQLVDDLGGVDVPVTVGLSDDCGGVPEGLTHMDGSTALCYARSRFSTGELRRAERLSSVLKSVFRKAMGIDAINHLPWLYRRYRDTVQTDVGLAEFLGLAPTAWRVWQKDRLTIRSIGGADVYDAVVLETGESVFVPNPERIRAELLAALSSLTPASEK
jgi:LCP family protein required for cell wall assembly